MTHVHFDIGLMAFVSGRSRHVDFAVAFPSEIQNVLSRRSDAFNPVPFVHPGTYSDMSPGISHGQHVDRPHAAVTPSLGVNVERLAAGQACLSHSGVPGVDVKRVHRPLLGVYNNKYATYVTCL
jgi:hypothetical protein